MSKRFDKLVVQRYRSSVLSHSHPGPLGHCVEWFLLKCPEVDDEQAAHFVRREFGCGPNAAESLVQVGSKVMERIMEAERLLHEEMGEKPSRVPSDDMPF